MKPVKLLFLTLFILMTVSLEASTIRVKNGQSIQSAINAAAAGDTLIIEKGTFAENEITIRKPLTIIGETYPVIDGKDKGNVFLVAAENVHIRGLKIINTGM